MLFSDKLRSQEGKTADFIVQFPQLTIRRFTIVSEKCSEKQMRMITYLQYTFHLFF